MTAATEQHSGIIVPSGYRYVFTIVALTKRALLADMPHAERLALLESMHGLTDMHFTPEMLAMIQPAGEAECAIISEALKLDDGLETPADRVIRGGSFEVLTSERVWRGLCALNSSFGAAIRSRFTVTAPDAAPNEPAPADMPSNDDVQRSADLAARNVLPRYGRAAQQFHERT